MLAADVLPGEVPIPTIPDTSWLDVQVGPKPDWRSVFVGGAIGLTIMAIVVLSLHQAS